MNKYFPKIISQLYGLCRSYDEKYAKCPQDRSSWSYRLPSRINTMMHTPTARTVSMIISSHRFIALYPPFKLYKMRA